MQSVTESIFSFNDHSIRVIMQDSQPWFVANDICSALGYLNSRKAIADHLDEDEKGVTISYTPGGNQKLTIISESGMYTLVLRSHKPEARKFAKWVTGEVLPTIRKTGGYGQLKAIDPLNPKLMKESRAVALEYLDAHEKAVKAGKIWANMDFTAPEALGAIFAHALMSQRLVAWFDPGTGKMQTKLIPDDSVMFSPTRGDYHSLAEWIPMSRLPELIDELNKRVASHIGAFEERLCGEAQKKIQ